MYRIQTLRPPASPWSELPDNLTLCTLHLFLLTHARWDAPRRKLILPSLPRNVGAVAGRGPRVEVSLARTRTKASAAQTRQMARLSFSLATLRPLAAG